MGRRERSSTRKKKQVNTGQGPPISQLIAASFVEAPAYFQTKIPGGKSVRADGVVLPGERKSGSKHGSEATSPSLAAATGNKIA